MKKLLSLLLALAMIFSLMSGMALASEEDTAAAEETVTDVADDAAEVPAGDAAEAPAADGTAEEAPAAEVPAADDAAQAAEEPAADGIADTKAPVLTGVSVSTDTAAIGGTVEVTVSATDILSGVSGCEIEFYAPDSEDLGVNNEFYCYLDCEYWDEAAGCFKPYADGNLHGTATIDASCVEGVYTPMTIDLYDNAGNHAMYSVIESISMQSMPDFAAACTVTVTDEGDAPETDTTAPELTGLTFSADTADAGSSITVTAKATDDMSGVMYIHIGLCPADEDDDSDVYLDCELFTDTEEPAAGEATLSGRLDIGAYIPGGDYIVDRIEVQDNEGNSINYYRGIILDSASPIGITVIDPFGPRAILPDDVLNYTLTVTNTEGVDLTAPELVSLSYSADTVTAGNTLEITAEATDDLSGVRFIEIMFYSTIADLWMNGNSYDCILSSEYWDAAAQEMKPYADGKFHGTLKIGQYDVGKTYVPYRIAVWDYADNCGEYGTNTGVDEDITPFLIPFTVKNPGGWYRTNGSWYYYLDDTGEYYADTTAEIGGTTYVFRADGTMISGWGQTSDGSWYYCSKSGAMQTGWLKQGGSWYYLDPKQGGAMATAWDRIGGDWYYFSASGRMVTGWQYIKDVDYAWYYFSASGRMVTGWLHSGSAWYYLDPNFSGAMATGWQYIDGSWFFFTDSGSMTTGWQYIDDVWYHFGTTGRMTTGWLKQGSTWYYLDPDFGFMYADGIYEIDGAWSSFSASGSWLGYTEAPLF